MQGMVISAGILVSNNYFCRESTNVRHVHVH